MARPLPRSLPQSVDTELVASGDRTLCLALCAMAALVAAVAAVIALAGALALAATEARASGELACASVPFIGERASTALNEHAGDPTMQQILTERALAWEANEIVRLCEARASGEDAALGCFEGRRDWSAIVASVPDAIRNGTLAERRTYLADLRRARRDERPRDTAEARCRALGVLAPAGN